MALKRVITLPAQGNTITVATTLTNPGKGPAPGRLRTLYPAGAPVTPREGRLAFAHSDWSGYSVFEEAFTRGHLAGLWAGGTGASRQLPEVKRS